MVEACRTAVEKKRTRCHARGFSPRGVRHTPCGPTQRAHHRPRRSLGKPPVHFGASLRDGTLAKSSANRHEPPFFKAVDQALGGRCQPMPTATVQRYPSRKTTCGAQGSLRLNSSFPLATSAPYFYLSTAPCISLLLPRVLDSLSPLPAALSCPSSAGMRSLKARNPALSTLSTIRPKRLSGPTSAVLPRPASRRCRSYWQSVRERRSNRNV